MENHVKQEPVLKCCQSPALPPNGHRSMSEPSQDQSSMAQINRSNQLTYRLMSKKKQLLFQASELGGLFVIQQYLTLFPLKAGRCSTTSSCFSVLDRSQQRHTAKFSLVGFIIDLLGEIFGLNFSFNIFSIRNVRSCLERPSRVLRSILSCVSPERLVLFVGECVLLQLFKCYIFL